MRLMFHGGALGASLSAVIASNVTYALFAVVLALLYVGMSVNKIGKADQ